MSWPAYVQRMLYGPESPVSLYGGLSLVMALQRFLLQNSYEQLMMQKQIEMAQAAYAQAQAQTSGLQGIPLLGGQSAAIAAGPVPGAAPPPPQGGWGDAIQSAIAGTPYVPGYGQIDPALIAQPAQDVWTEAGFDESGNYVDPVTLEPK